MQQEYGLINPERYMLINVSEELIAMYLKDCLQASGTCQCDRCKIDIVAIALNDFPPNYVVSDFGDMMVRTRILGGQFRVDVVTAIMHAIKKVSERPRHTQEDLDALEKHNEGK